MSESGPSFAKPLPVDPDRYGLLVRKPQEKDEITLRVEQEAKDEAQAEAEAIKDPQVPLLYTPPFWSGKPAAKYSLELIDGGRSMGKKKLWHKGWFLIGRAPICDIVLEHPSVSRQHAVIQYKKNGEAYLYDLNSTHGTFIGKSKVKAQVYVPLQQGNNVIRFGTSSKQYILDVDKEEGADGEESEEDDEDEDAKKEEELSKEKKSKDTAFLNLLKKAPKASNPESNTSKKKAKLTKQEEMAIELDEVDDEMKFLDEHLDFYKELYNDETDDFFDRTGKHGAKKRKKMMEKEDANVVETYDTLAAKEKVLQQNVDMLRKEIIELQEEEASIKALDTAASGEGDELQEELDRYMRKNALQPIRDKLRKKKSLLAELEKSLSSISTLAAAARPALYSLTETSNITEEQIRRVARFAKDILDRKAATDLKLQSAKEKTDELKAQMNAFAQVRAQKRKEDMAKKGLAKVEGALSTSTTSNGESSETTSSPPPVVQGVTRSIVPKAAVGEKYKPSFIPIGPLPPPPSDELEGEDRMDVQEYKPDGDASEPQDNVDADAEGEVEGQDRKRKRSAFLDDLRRRVDEDDEPKKKKKKKKARFDEEVDNGNAYDNWAPPVGQTGDGRTHLNEKFGY